ncbi:hypothetical protein MKW92_036482 [Papaver armeniacum]|nr:hypothetical protein MKW92_036482 [Papaver armeniacum]
MEFSSSSTTGAIPMTGGDGRNSYANNSSLQRIVVDRSKSMIEEAIANHLDIQICPSSNTFRMADLGCSVGPNTFIAMKNIIEAIDLKYRKSGSSPEFHVFFNDHASNDFNTLFVSLPPEKPYFAAGVPGSFHTRLFPKRTLHIVHSTNSLHWLSQVPKEVTDINSPAYNKGRVHYTNARYEVFKAYSAQYAKDIEAFLHARAEEIVSGGLMLLTVSAIPDEAPTELGMGPLIDILGSCLMDMANMGTLEEAKVDSFNVPVYKTTPREMKKLVERNECFNIERIIDILPRENNLKGVSAQTYSDHTRAIMEGVIKLHFGCSDHTIDHLFRHLYPKKLEDSLANLLKSMGKSIVLFLILRRK